MYRKAKSSKLTASAYINYVEKGTNPDIGIIGAGFSGICAAVQLQEQLKIKSFTIFERNEDVGGTWLVNTYPGCACDVFSHLYSFSFENNPNWSENYSSQLEILAYMRNVARKYNVYSHVKFNTVVKTLYWDDDLKKWIVSYVNTSTSGNKEQEMAFDILINGCGALREPNIPEEFMSFKGPYFHSAQWDSSVDLDKTKIVAIVGSGASAIQIIPAIVEKVKELHVYQRKPASVVPRIQFEFPAYFKWIFAYLPIFMVLCRYLIFISYELTHPVFHHDSIPSRLAQKIGRFHRNRQIPNNPELIRVLTPKYAFGCTRVNQSEHYYPALRKSHVTVHSIHIDQVTDDSIITKDGNRQKIDVLILATGFRVQDYFLPMKIYGKDGVDIINSWKTKPMRHYKGIVSSNLPNFFYILGPNTGLGHNSVIFHIECQVDFIMAVIKGTIKRQAKSITVKPSVEDEFMYRLKRNMKKTVWGNSDCGSWYRSENGEINTLWPLSSTAYWMETRKINFDEYDFE